MTQPLKTSPRHDHVYAIVRYEMGADDAPLEFRINVIKVVTDPNLAESEVKRLNDLNHDKAYYFSQVTRIEKGVLETVPVSGLTIDLPAERVG